jgi:PAS domain S-box-containing protein
LTRERLLSLVLLSGLAVLSAGAFDSTDRFDSRHQRLQRVVELDAKLKQSVLELRYGLHKDYDSVAEMANELGQISLDLERDDGLDSRELVGLVARERELVDDFESNLAILKNSISFVPTLMDELERSEDTGPRTRMRLVELERRLWRFVATPDPQARGSLVATLTELRSESGKVEPGSTQGIRLLEDHVATILRQEPLVRDLVARITSLPTNGAAGTLVDRSREERFGQVASRWRARTALVALVIVLSGLAIRKTIGVHRRAAATLEANAELERRVEERTAELARKKLQLRLILESAGEGICGLNCAGETTFANASAAQQLGYEPDEIVGLAFHPLAHARTADGREYRSEACPITAVMADGELRHVTDEVFQRKDGTFFPVEYRARAMHREGFILGAVITFSDISERKRAEAELAALHEQLFVAHRRAGMAEVATGVLHNVGNVLNSLKVSSSLVLDFSRSTRLEGLRRAVSHLFSRRGETTDDSIEEPTPAQIHEYLRLAVEHLQEERDALQVEAKRIQRSVVHIQESVARQQTYATGSSIRERVRMEEVLEDAVGMQLDERHDLEIDRSYESVPEVLVDKHKLLQILANLVRNGKEAIQELPPERGRLALVVRSSVDGSKVRVEVRDNGIGIAADERERLFGFGFTTKRNGHGYGLHASAIAAKEMGAELSCDSPGRGKGAVFWLELPIDPGACGAKAPPGEGNETLQKTPMSGAAGAVARR